MQNVRPRGRIRERLGAKKANYEVNTRDNQARGKEISCHHRCIKIDRPLTRLSLHLSEPQHLLQKRI